MINNEGDKLQKFKENILNLMNNIERDSVEMMTRIFPRTVIAPDG